MIFITKLPANIEAAYRSIKSAHSQSFFKLVNIVACWVVIVAIIASIMTKQVPLLILMCCGLLLLLILLRFGYKVQKYMNIVIFLLSLALYYGALINKKFFATQANESYDSFYYDSFFGIFEAIMVQWLPSLEFKLVFSILAIFGRFLFFMTSSIDIIIFQIFLWVMSAIVTFWTEKNDRTLFKTFYDYRDELTKFKNLMVSGLPTNILILKKDFQESLFINKNFETTFHAYGISDITTNPTSWLNQFTLEKDSLSLNAKEAIGEEAQAGEMRLNEFLEILHEKKLLDNLENQFCFNVKTKPPTEGSTKMVFESKIFPLVWDGNEAIVIILTDVTEQSLNLALRIADANKDKMIAMVSHELRTPLNGILGMLCILEKQINDEQLLKYLTVCENNGKLLLNIVNSILDLGQIRNNKFKLVVSRGDLEDLLREIYQLFEFQFQVKGIYLRMDIMAGIDRTIVTDLTRLKQVMINLIGNAMKYTFEGGVSLYVGEDENRPGYLQFRISDTGIGIKDEEKKNLFKMYGRLDQPVNSEGVGLGLTISEHLVRMLSNNGEGGGIRVESDFGRGTTFIFSVKTDLNDCERFEYNVGNTEGREHSQSVDEYQEAVRRVSQYISHSNSLFGSSDFALNKKVSYLATRHQSRSRRGSDIESLFPRNQMPFDMSAPISHSSIQAHEDDRLLNSPKDKGQVLLVDDSPFNIIVAKQFLENLGYQVKTALNGKIAVDMVKELKLPLQTFKIIFMDCQMPVMDGFEATKILKQLMSNGEVPDIPIVALSAIDSEEDKKRCRDVGMADHLPKPIDEMKLKLTLQKYCK